MPEHIVLWIIGIATVQVIVTSTLCFVICVIFREPCEKTTETKITACCFPSQRYRLPESVFHLEEGAYHQIHDPRMAIVTPIDASDYSEAIITYIPGDDRIVPEKFAVVGPNGEIRVIEEALTAEA